MNRVAEPMLNLYTPQRQSKQQLLAEFIDRKGIRERILGILRHNAADKPQQHVILIGPRGMGKTTLLCAIRYSVEEDAELGAAWLPLQFYEEQYNIGDLADFWLECLRHLEHALDRRPEAADRLLDERPADLADRAQARFFEILAETGKRALLLVDNLQEIFAAIDDGHALHKLRALWMTDPRMTVIGAAPSYFEEITAVDQAFHDFFRPFVLERLSQGEMETCLRHYADILKDDTVPKVIEQAPERVAALRILTGGNPRLVKLGYRVLRDGLEGDLRQDLERLLDEATPFFKHRIDSLAKEARRAFDAIAKRWDPVTVDDIRKELRKPSNYVSAQIKRLVDDGFIEEIGGEKKKLYQVSERFYNVYYLWRVSREGRKRLRWLVCFMRVLYRRKDFLEWTKKLESDLAGSTTETIREEKLAHLHALYAAADDHGRAEIFDAMVRDAIFHDDRMALDEETREGDPVETHGWRFLVVNIIWMLDREARVNLGFRPCNAIWQLRLARLLAQSEVGKKAYDYLIEAYDAHKKSSIYMMAIGVVLQSFWEQPVQAEIAFKNAIEINPDDSRAYHYLAMSLVAQGRYQKAKSAYRKSLEINSKSARTWSGLGRVFIAQERYDEAEEAFQRGIQLDADYSDIWLGLGVSLAGQNLHIKAEEAFNKSIALDPSNFLAWHNLGFSLAYQFRFQEAKTAYLNAQSLAPEFALVYLNLCKLYINTKNFEECVSELLRGLKLSNSHGFAFEILAEYWQMILPAAAKIAANASGASYFRTVLTEVLLERAAAGEQATVRDALLALDETGQAIFEPLLLALRALDDRAILQRIAREKRDLVQDVMQRIAAEPIEAESHPPVNQ